VAKHAHPMTWHIMYDGGNYAHACGTSLASLNLDIVYIFKINQQTDRILYMVIVNFVHD
jgi:hypothetical protein